MFRLFTKNIIKRNYRTEDVSKMIVSKYELSDDLASVLNTQNRLLDLIERQNIEQLKCLKTINEQLQMLSTKK